MVYYKAERPIAKQDFQTEKMLGRREMQRKQDRQCRVKVTESRKRTEIKRYRLI